MWFFIVLAIGLMVAIIVINGVSSTKKTREMVLEQLAKFVHGQVEPVEEFQNSYRIKFKYENYDFFYEDIQGVGFADEVYNTCLKVKSITNLNLRFMEKQQTKVTPFHQFSSSDGASGEAPKPRQDFFPLPKSLQAFQLATNNPSWAEKLITDAKTERLFKKMKGVDSRGHPFMPLKVVEGMVVLEFPSAGAYYPRPLVNRDDVSSIEQQIQELLFIVEKIIEVDPQRRM